MREAERKPEDKRSKQSPQWLESRIHNLMISVKKTMRDQNETLKLVLDEEYQKLAHTNGCYLFCSNFQIVKLLSLTLGSTLSYALIHEVNVTFCSLSFLLFSLSSSPNDGSFVLILITERVISQSFFLSGASVFPKETSCGLIIKKVRSSIPRCSDASNSSGGKDESSNQQKTPFGYTRKDVLLIGLGVTRAGIGLERGLEFIGVDPLQAGNVVQLVLVLGLTVGWIYTYIFRVSNKEMTYAQQLRDYEDKVMQVIL
ncbi:uncharacterized protein LOC111375769 [Olea europaea var. sylvestris]|uniref:uncharacterized protein LOC111375769 n=1 Tax=Olea europaea var. sylvestris TaxID=158386 RepID=UPI000C1D0DD5|nr:uncharacterized protein LOC111375769 [Olea europaea var. sylvestris]